MVIGSLDPLELDMGTTYVPITNPNAPSLHKGVCCENFFRESEETVKSLKKHSAVHFSAIQNFSCD